MKRHALFAALPLAALALTALPAEAAPAKVAAAHAGKVDQAFKTLSQRRRRWAFMTMTGNCPA